MKKILTLSLFILLLLLVTSCNSDKETKKENNKNSVNIENKIIKTEDGKKIAKGGEVLENTSLKNNEQTVNIENVLGKNIEVGEKGTESVQEIKGLKY